MSKKVQALEAVEVLTGARNILESKSRWVKGAFAKDKHGYNVDVASSDAVKFCSIGACRKVSGNHASVVNDYLEAAFNGDVVDKNDASRTRHKHVLMAFDFAILMAEDDARKVKAAK